MPRKLRYMKRFFFIYFIWTCLSSHLSSILAEINLNEYKDYHQSWFSIKNGLSHNCVYHIYKDSKGFIWISTQRGLSKFDGNFFLNYASSNKEILSSTSVRGVVEDNFHHLWVATERGIQILDLYTNHIIKLSVPQELLTTPINYVQKDLNGNLIISTETNLYIASFNPNGEIKKYQSLFSNYDKYINSITAIFVFGNQIWLSYGKNIYRLTVDNNLKINSTKVINCSFLEEGDNIRCLNYINGGILLIGTDNGFYRYNTLSLNVDKYKFIIDNMEIPTVYVSDISTIGNDRVLVATSKGIFTLTPNSNEFTLLLLDNNKYNNIFATNHIYVNGKQIWIGTETLGVLLLNPFNIHFSDIGNLNINIPLSSIFEDSNKNIWLGSVNGDIWVKKDSLILSHFDLKNKWENKIAGIVKDIVEDPQQRIWIATQGGGIHLFSAEINKEIKHLNVYTDNNSLLNSNHITSLCLDTLNNGMWIGTISKLFFYDFNINNFISVPLPTDHYFNNELTETLIDKNNNLWIGTKYGLIILNLYSFAKRRCNLKYKYLPYCLNNSIEKEYEKINCIYQDTQNNIWIGSNIHGLYKFLGNVEKHSFIFEKDSIISKRLPNYTIFGIQEEKKNILWLTSNYGILRYDLANKNINLLNNILPSQCHLNILCKSKTGAMYIGGCNGIRGIKSIEENKSANSDTVIFTRFFVQDKEFIEADGKISAFNISNSKKITIHERNKSFTLEFSILNFDNTKNISYQYRLKGFDSHWIYSDNIKPFAKYTNIPAGTYYFQVKPILLDGSKIKTIPITEMEIIIVPYFYKTIWFITIVISFIIYILIHIYHWRMASIKKRENEMAEIIKTRTYALEEKMEELSSQNSLLEVQKMQMEKMSKEIQEITADKLNFFTNITHEFKTPITLIVGPIERAIKISENEKVIDLLHIVERSSKALLLLVNQLLDFRKIDSGYLVLNKTSVNIIDWLENTILPFRAYANERNIQLNVYIRVCEFYFIFDEENLRKVIGNLLSNAIKFTPNNGRISIYVATLKKEENQRYVYFCVSDTGKGVKKKDRERIFDRFYQASENTQYSFSGQYGTGIGLYLCKKIVEEHGGRIFLKKHNGPGTSFAFILPLDLDINPEKKQEKKNINIKNDSIYFTKIYTILIVEDNEDMLFYLSSIFSTLYNIESAKNGEEGLKILLQKHIDFILSDIMMPIMDGIKFAQKVRNNLQISHIPILFLTAKDGQETQIESFKIGVDEYIQKPFNEDLLLTRVENILKAREKMIKNFNKSLDSSNLIFDEDSKDKKIFDLIMDVIEKNYENSNLDVKLFAEMLGMSKTLVNQKIQNLMGMSTGKFINKYRLKKAYQLLVASSNNHVLNVSEIAYQVGFNDPKYFTRCFFKEYNILPSKFLASNPKDNDSQSNVNVI